MKATFTVGLASLIAVIAANAAEFHVAITGSDAGTGTVASPWRTIQHAADLAQPGDVITVHAGVYRERVNPPRGGISDTQRITYQAAPGETVEITGSELVTNWTKVQGDVWQAVLPNSRFGGFNPFNDLIHGDWFANLGRKHHTGAVYLNGEWLVEAAKAEELLRPTGAEALWFTTVDAQNTTIRAQFPGVNPNEQRVEVNARQSVFYPEQTGINFITVRGFVLCDAATPWAPPTAEQIGLIGTHWSQGWIIESNVISHSVCAGVSLGKYGDVWDNRAGSAVGYVGTINRALTNGWNAATIGHHLVRHNEISHCEQAGIVGSLGGAFSVITGNNIHDIHVRRRFSGAEMAGIKLHGAVDVEISHNHIYRCSRGLWLDWMAQGTRVSGNLFNDNGAAADFKGDNWAEKATPGGLNDIYVEVDHGPFLMDNNLFLSPFSIYSRSQGGAYVHNLFAGVMRINPMDKRQTPFLRPHATAVAGLHDNPCGDDRYYNNIFAGHADLGQYAAATLPVAMAGNIFLRGAKPSKFETTAVVDEEFDPALRLTEAADGWHLAMKALPAADQAPTRPLVTTKLLGRALIPNEAYEQPDGSPIRLDTDYFGRGRDAAHVLAGPFSEAGTDEAVRVWPVALP